MTPLLYTAHLAPGRMVHQATAGDPTRTGCNSWTASFPVQVSDHTAYSIGMVFCAGCFNNR